MSRRTSEQSDSEWAQAFQRVVASKEKLPPGEGWLTTDQLRQKIKLGNRRFYSALIQLRSTGAVEMFRGQQLRNGKCSPMVWYRLKPSATRTSARTR